LCMSSLLSLPSPSLCCHRVCSRYPPRYFLALFCLLLPRSRSSSLVPYTPLFRSGRSKPVFMPFLETTTADVKPSPASSGVAGTRDRKSTRLNSSHVSISYAVFCFKKKILGHTHC